MIHGIIKPIFVDLSDDNLLSKCLHGSTQNVNEALNQIIWNKCPKQVFVEKKMLEIGVYSAMLENSDWLLVFRMFWNGLMLLWAGVFKEKFEKCECF